MGSVVRAQVASECTDVPWRDKEKAHVAFLEPIPQLLPILAYLIVSEVAVSCKTQRFAGYDGQSDDIWNSYICFLL